MKKLLLSAFSLAFGFGAMAQPDISIRMTSPADNSTITAGTQFNFDVVITNTGNEPIDANDTILYAPTINGSLLGNGQGGSVVYGSITSTLAVGDSISFSETLNLSGGQSGTLNFCAIAVVTGQGWSGVTESDTLNNEDCASVTYNSGNISTSEFTLASASDNSYFSNGVYHVRLENFAFIDGANVRVINIAGAEVYNTTINSQGNKVEQELNLTSLNGGIYIVQISNGKEIISTKKIMVD